MAVSDADFQALQQQVAALESQVTWLRGFVDGLNPENQFAARLQAVQGVMPPASCHLTKDQTNVPDTP